MQREQIREIHQEGPYHFTMGPYHDPVASVENGETVAIYTEDAFGGSITSEEDRPSGALGPYLNPQTGPIYVDGAEPGDTLAVRSETSSSFSSCAKTSRTVPEGRNA